MIDILKDGDVLSIDLSAAVGHAVPERFRAAERDLPFYWDFEQSDRFIIDLQFDREVEFIALDDLSITMTTPHASVVRSVVSEAPDHVRIESVLLVHGLREEVVDAQSLQALIDVAMAKDLVLRFKPRSGQP